MRASSSSAFRPQYDLSGDDLGPGWERQFSDWVNAHKFYPREAAQNDEEGDVAVKLVISHTGQVMGVTLLQRSGSQWLDEALQALFRSQRLPPLPESYGSGPATENVLMHYILIHR